MVGFVLVFTLLLLLATLGQTPPFNKEAINIGGLVIAWYAVFILTGNCICGYT